EGWCTTPSAPWSSCRNVTTAVRFRPRSTSTTTWLLSRAIRQRRDACGSPPAAANAAVTTASGGSLTAASCTHVTQRRDSASSSALHTLRPQYAHATRCSSHIPRPQMGHAASSSAAAAAGRETRRARRVAVFGAHAGVSGAVLQPAGRAHLHVLVARRQAVHPALGGPVVRTEVLAAH